MAGLKEIRRRIRSVKSTKKITYAMKLVSAVKLRKAQDAVTRAREYTSSLGSLLGELVREQDGASFSHPLMSRHEQVKNVRCLVIGGSRGLCGAYNMSINKAAESFVTERRASAKVECYLLGKKVAEYFRHRKMPTAKLYERLAEDPNLWPIEEICSAAERDFLSGAVDEVVVIYTKFRSALSMRVEVQKLLPFDREMIAGLTAEGEQRPAGLTLFEPSPQQVFATLVPLCLRVRLRQAGLDAKASEHGSRMSAMENATKNAGELIDKLTLLHNKLRQAGITGEILDIIGGAQPGAK